MSLFSLPQIYYAPDDGGAAGGIPTSGAPGAPTAAPKGVSPSAKKLENVLGSLDESNKRLYKMLNKVLGMNIAEDKEDNSKSGGLIETLQNELLSPLKEMFNPAELFSGIFGKDSSLLDGILGSESKSSKEKPKEKPKISDMMKLAAGDATGFTFLYWKLDEIAGLLKAGGSGKEEKGKGIGGFFQGLLQGAAGLALLAGSMMLFAGALILFAKLEGSDWTKALFGIGMFALFVAGAVVVAKTVSKETGTFFDFAKGVLVLTAALILFGAAVFVMAWVLPYVIPAIPGMLLFGVFVYEAVKVANIVGENLKNFTKFGLGMIALTGSLILFGAAVFVMAWALPYVIPAVPGMVLFGLFAYGAAKVASIVGDNLENFTKFGAGMILLTVGLALFAGTIWFINKYAPLEAVLGALPTLGAMIVFIGAGVAVAALLTASMPAFIMFAQGVILMSIGLLLFGYTVKSVSEISLDNLLTAGIVVLGMGAFALLATGVGWVLGQPPFLGAIGAFAIASILVSANLLLFGLAVRSVAGITMEDLKTAGIIVLGMGAFALGAAAVGYGLLLGIPGIIAFATTSMALSAALIIFGEAIKAVKAAGDDVEGALPALQKMMLFLTNPGGEVDGDGKPRDSKGYPGVVQLMKGMSKNVRTELGKFGDALVPFSEGMLNFARVIDMVAKIGDPVLIDAAVMGIARMLGFLVGGGPDNRAFEESVAGMMAGMNEEVTTRLQSFGQALTPLSTALLNFADVIRQTADMDRMVEAAMPSIRKMVNFLTQDEGEGETAKRSIASLVSAITPWMAQAMANFGTALTPFADGLSTFAGVIRDVQGMPDIEAALVTIRKMTDFLSEASIVAGNVGGGTGFLGLGKSNMDKFEAAIVPFGKGLRSFADIASDFARSREQIENSGTTLSVMTGMLVAAGAVVDTGGGPDKVGEFAKSLEILGKGINKFSGELEGSKPFILDRIADALERIAQIQFGQMFTPFIEFMSYNNTLKETATQLERINDAITPKQPTTLDRISGAIGSIFRGGGDRANINEAEVASYMSPSSGGGSIEENVSTIARIISNWNDAPPITLASGQETNVILLQGAAASRAASSFGSSFGNG